MIIAGTINILFSPGRLLSPLEEENVLYHFEPTIKHVRCFINDLM